MRFGQEAMFCLLPFVFELLLSYKQREHITVAALCFLIMHVPVPGKGMPDLSMKGRNDLMRKEQDLTTGNVSKKLIKFAVPLLLANLLQSFYSIMDMLVVGRFVGETGLAAISNASMISFIINSICIGVTMGGTVLVAQYKGADDEEGQRENCRDIVFPLLLCLITSHSVRAACLPAAFSDTACSCRVHAGRLRLYENYLLRNSVRVWL